MAEPSSGASSECASPSSATPVLPLVWKVAAARIRIEALIVSANISATVESMVANLQRLALLRQRLAIGAGLHDAGMQVEIVRHHGGADDAEREVEHLRVGDDLASSARSRG